VLASEIYDIRILLIAPGHNVYNVDPPAGAKNVLDCDAKADVGMLNVALNCMPVTEETTEHVKP